MARSKWRADNRDADLLATNLTEVIMMPPLARNTIDEQGMKLLRQWIESLPGPTILRARAFRPGFTKSVPAQQIFFIGG